MGSHIRNQRGFLLVLARRIVPAAALLDTPGQEALLALIDDALSVRSVATRRQFAVFLRVLRWLPVARYGRPLDHLTPDRQDEALRWFQDSPLPLLRSGLWGVRTLVLLGYYGRTDVGAQIAYRPSRFGNALLHDR